MAFSNVSKHRCVTEARKILELAALWRFNSRLVMPVDPSELARIPAGAGTRAVAGKLF
jgi:hypothetical protein